MTRIVKALFVAIVFAMAVPVNSATAATSQIVDANPQLVLGPELLSFGPGTASVTGLGAGFVSVDGLGLGLEFLAADNVSMSLFASDALAADVTGSQADILGGIGLLEILFDVTGGTLTGASKVVLIATYDAALGNLLDPFSPGGSDALTATATLYEVTAVPLPAGIIFAVSGLALLFGVQRRRRKLAA